MSAASKSPGGDQGNRTSRVSGTATDYGNTATTPPAPAITFDNIPNELKQYPHWVIWKYVLVPGKKPDKVLYSPIDGAKASHAPEGAPRWGTFDQALEAYNKPYGGWSGIGFVFSPEDPFTGIDFDGPENMGRWARRFDSYTEHYYNKL